MKRILAAVLLVTLAAPSWAEEILYCTDTDAIGFTWDRGKDQARRTNFTPKRFTVKVVSKTERIIIEMSGLIKTRYSCIESTQIFCSSGVISALNPFIFAGDNYERVINFGGHVRNLIDVGGDLHLMVAYGTCTKF